MNITIDDTSPRLRYYSALSTFNRTWSRATEETDTDIANYHGSSYTVTAGEGDRMVFKFNGSAIWVFGSKDFNHGWFTVRIDDRDPVLKVNTTSDKRQYQSLLHYEKLPTSHDEHTITLTNLAGDGRRQPGWDYYLDIDYVIVQQLEFERPIDTTLLAHDSPRIEYRGGWVLLPGEMGSTRHVSRAWGDSAALTFEGTSVEVIGILGPNNGNYTVAIDGVGKGMYNGSAVQRLYNVSLFSASGLLDVRHTITLTNMGQPTASMFEIDRIIYNSTIDPTAGPYFGPPGWTKGPSRGAIAGGAVGGVLALLLIAALAWWVWRKRRRGAGQGVDQRDGTAVAVKSEAEGAREASGSVSPAAGGAARPPLGRNRSSSALPSQSSSDQPQQPAADPLFPTTTSPLRHGALPPLVIPDSTMGRTPNATPLLDSKSATVASMYETVSARHPEGWYRPTEEVRGTPTAPAGPGRVGTGMPRGGGEDGGGAMPPPYEAARPLNQELEWRA